MFREDFPCLFVSLPSVTSSLAYKLGFPSGAVVKNSPANVGDAEDTGSIPGSGQPPGVGNGNPLYYSCLENPRDRGTWWAIIYRITKSQTGLK